MTGVQTCALPISLVENVIDAVDTIVKSEIKYLYLPEIDKLIYKDDPVQV